MTVALFTVLGAAFAAWLLVYLPLRWHSLMANRRDAYRRNVVIPWRIHTRQLRAPWRTAHIYTLHAKSATRYFDDVQDEWTA